MSAICTRLLRGADCLKPVEFKVIQGLYLHSPLAQRLKPRAVGEDLDAAQSLPQEAYYKVDVSGNQKGSKRLLVARERPMESTPVAEISALSL